MQRDGDAALHRGLRAPSRCIPEPSRLKSTRDSTHRWMKEGAQVINLNIGKTNRILLTTPFRSIWQVYLSLGTDRGDTRQLR